MKTKAIFYHAGCPVCIEAESILAHAIDPERYDLKSIHLAEQPEYIKQAEEAGVRSVPAILLDEQVFHINFGADLTQIKEGA